MEFYLAIKRHEMILFARQYFIMLSKVSQTQKHKSLNIFSPRWNLGEKHHECNRGMLEMWKGMRCRRGDIQVVIEVNMIKVFYMHAGK
jgi:hypothetical protein